MSHSRRHFHKMLGGAAAALGLPGKAQIAVFQHGVASGDPLQDRVILWTRISSATGPVSVAWVIAEDPAFTTIAGSGAVVTHQAIDYTVKVDAGGLQAGRTYYYRFTCLGAQSPVGRTRTLPATGADRVRFAVVSCSNYPQGYFNAYRLIAARTDLQFVLHLGDYIYEYGDRGEGLGRTPEPNREIVSLADYRQRYAQYRTDRDLQEVHRQHPMIVVWDDHESANNAWQHGADNHQPETEGAWAVRKAASAQAWREWLPVRTGGLEIYRSFRVGGLIDLLMLDTRLIGRDRQLSSFSPRLDSPARTILGTEQEAWLASELNSSRSRGTAWRILGQQVMFAQLVTPEGIPVNPDQWDGYADLHSSWGAEVSADPFTPGYATLGVEFITPAVSSSGATDPEQAKKAEALLYRTHPHIKYVDLYNRGYLLMDIDRTRARGEWWHVGTVLQPSSAETLARVLESPSGTNRLVPATA
jgi:alkaline phosphatase D